MTDTAQKSTQLAFSRKFFIAHSYAIVCQGPGYPSNQPHGGMNVCKQAHWPSKCTKKVLVKLQGDFIRNY